MISIPGRDAGDALSGALAISVLGARTENPSARRAELALPAGAVAPKVSTNALDNAAACSMRLRMENSVSLLGFAWRFAAMSTVRRERETDQFEAAFAITFDRQTATLILRTVTRHHQMAGRSGPAALKFPAKFSPSVRPAGLQTESSPSMVAITRHTISNHQFHLMAYNSPRVRDNDARLVLVLIFSCLSNFALKLLLCGHVCLHTCSSRPAEADSSVATTALAPEWTVMARRRRCAADPLVAFA